MLANKKVYSRTNEDDLNPEVRFYRIIKDKISPHIKDKAIFCLQEFPQSWIGKFHEYFSNKNYQIIYANYGHKYNDYMGVCMAYPIEKYKILKTELINVGATLKVIKVVKASNIFYRFYEMILMMLIKTLMWYSPSFKKYYEEITFNPLYYAAGRNNILLLNRLYCKKSKKVINIATYHMPCSYWCPEVMGLHSFQAMKLAQEFVQDHTDDDLDDNRLIFCVDLNSVPASDQYKNIISGNYNGKTLIAMKSAYDNSKPTCHTFTTLSNKYFTDTIDYIFYNGDIELLKVGDLPDAIEDEPWPNEKEPSDHALLYAEFKF
jgi:mRNA deadenylase 3'-5' endonuclease subunit Ccr4